MDENADGIAVDDDAYSPKGRESKPWLDMLAEHDKALSSYHDKCDNIDKLYANLERLAGISKHREFQLFWSNIQVLAPSIYSRPPVPVVVPRFKDRRPLYRTASEFLERASATAFDLSNINAVMKQIRDDLTIVARGVPWVRYETRENKRTPEKVCIEWVHRKDFRHELARCWEEVGWVERTSWMTMDELEERFKETSGDAYLQAAMKTLRVEINEGAATRQQKAAVSEIWSKTENKVVWVTEGVDTVLDMDEPHLELEGFFPCPKPAYGTVQRGGLIPVPDMLFYRDQLEEINQLTSRIHALSEALRVKGFYPGGGETGDAIEAAFKINDDNAIMVPISNWAAFGSGGEKIIWLPIAEVAQVIAGLVELRRAVIDDVYQIIGLSDIMRGSTEKDETLGAQELKAQFGSIRIRDKQSELVRVARDLVSISAEIMAENFSQKTLVDMSQMEIPTDADIKRRIDGIAKQAEQINAGVVKQIEQAKADPQIMQQAQQDPEAAQQQLNQLVQQAQQQIDGLQAEIAKLEETVTIEQVMKLLRDQRTRPFALDIETDSTIQPDENAEKEARTEFVTALGGLIAQFGPVVEQQPELMPMVGETIKFALAPYRVGRELEGKIDEAIENLMKRSGQPKEDPEAQKAKAEQQAAMDKHKMEIERIQAEGDAKAKEIQARSQAEAQKIQGELGKMQADAAAKQQESQARLEQIAAQGAMQAEKHAQDMEKGQLEKERIQLQMVNQQRQAEMQREQADQSFSQQSAINAQKAQSSWVDK
jgi:hypothetical protein